MLDRLLQREVSVEVEVPAATTYAYDAEYLSSFGTIPDGEWRRASDTVLEIATNDSNGLDFPDDLPLPINGVEVSWDGATATILNVTGTEGITDINGLPQGQRLTFDGTLPVAGTTLSISHPTAGTQTVTQTATRPTWCSRRDFVGRDFLRVGPVSGSQQLIGITSTRFTVRAEGPPWAIHDVFVDDLGATQTVQSVAEVGGRGRFNELLTQSTDA